LENPTDSRLHLGLIPIPYFGDLNEATAFILMLNPGFGSGDYYGEYKVPALRAAMVSNLRQEPGRQYPLLSLNPEFSWHSGAHYWRPRLHWLALAIAQQKGTTYLDALSTVARRVCILQLVPYHSTAFALPGRILSQLESPDLAKTFVHDHILTKSDVLILVTRQSRYWSLPERANIVTYEGSETRAALLSQRTRGGQALAKHLGLRAG
jgi:hypothetical protein